MASEDKESQKPSTSGSPDVNKLRGLVNRRGLALGSSVRLPSIRSPRDLTLGGSSTKRVFTPTIPVRKSRNKEDEQSQPPGRSNDKGPGRGRGSEGRGRGRGERGRGQGRGRGRGELIQAQDSIFGQGYGDQKRKERGTKYSNDNTPIQRTFLQATPRLTKAEEEERLQKILRDDFVEDDHEDDGFHPVQLPLIAIKCKDEKIEEKPKIKIEKMDIDEQDELDKKPESEIKEEKKPKLMLEDKKPPLVSKEVPELSVPDLFLNAFDTDEGELLFFQLPDTLPGFPLNSDESSFKPKHEQRDVGEGTSSGNVKIKKEPKDENKGLPAPCHLSNMSEGCIGKLQILKSGRTRLVLGGVVLNVELGTQVGFLQDLVAVNIEEQSTSSMVVLGHVKHRLVCVPDIHNLFGNTIH